MYEPLSNSDSIFCTDTFYYLNISLFILNVICTLYLFIKFQQKLAEIDKAKIVTNVVEYLGKDEKSSKVDDKDEISGKDDFLSVPNRKKKKTSLSSILKEKPVNHKIRVSFVTVS